MKKERKKKKERQYYCYVVKIYQKINRHKSVLLEIYVYVINKVLGEKKRERLHAIDRCIDLPEFPSAFLNQYLKKESSSITLIESLFFLCN